MHVRFAFQCALSCSRHIFFRSSAISIFYEKKRSFKTSSVIKGIFEKSFQTTIWGKPCAINCIQRYKEKDRVDFFATGICFLQCVLMFSLYDALPCYRDPYQYRSLSLSHSEIQYSNKNKQKIFCAHSNETEKLELIFLHRFKKNSLISKKYFYNITISSSLKTIFQFDL